MVKIKYSKRTQPIALKKTVCVILPRLDYNDFIRERRRRSLSNASSCRGDSPKITAVIKPCKKRLRVKKEPPCQFHSEVDISNEDVAEEIPGVLREPRNNTRNMCLHDVTRSMCYMCSPVPEDKTEIWTEINWHSNANTANTLTASSPVVKESCNEIRNWHTPVATTGAATASSCNEEELRDEIPRWHTPIVAAPLLNEVNECEIVESQGNINHTVTRTDIAVGTEVNTSTSNTVITVDQATQTVRGFACKYCPAIFSEFTHLMHHKTVHQKMFECVFCSAHFIAKNDLKSHMKLHMLPKHYECVYCTQAFTKKHDIKEHLALHVEQRLFHCLTCPAIFTQKNLLRLHEKSHSIRHKFVHVFKKMSDDVVLEPQVSRAPLSETLVDNSLRSISSSVPENEVNNSSISVTSIPAPAVTSVTVPTRACNSVTNVFKSNVTLKFYNCENCSLSFNALSGYKRHQKCHTRKCGKFVCGGCGARFLQKACLTMHERAAHKSASV